MKIKTETITTKNYMVTLEPDEFLALKVNKNIFGLKITSFGTSLDFYNLKEGSLIGDPALSVGFDDLEDLASGYPKPTETTYINISFPAKLYPQVKKRLQGLPIALPTMAE